MPKLTPVAIAYDFDGTLSPANMQEYDFIPALGIKPAAFWQEADRIAREQDADVILAYMHCMLEQARQKRVPVTRQAFLDCGGKIAFFAGVEEWFGRINAYGRKQAINVEHFIISSGLREMIQGTKIAVQFKAIYASSYMYDNNNAACFPALAVNYTTKTQYLFRINKGSFDVYDNSRINKFVPDAERPVPFSQIIYLGDGETDIPCMRLVKAQGGHSLALFNPETRNAKAQARQLVQEGRASLAVPTDYRDGSPVDTAVKAIIDLVAARNRIENVMQ